MRLVQETLLSTDSLLSVYLSLCQCQPHTHSVFQGVERERDRDRYTAVSFATLYGKLSYAHTEYWVQYIPSVRGTEDTHVIRLDPGRMTGVPESRLLKRPIYPRTR